MGIFKSLGDHFKNLQTQLFGQWKVKADPSIGVVQSMQKDDGLEKTLIYNFFNISQTKEGIIESIDNIKNFYFSQLIIDRLMDDALNPTSQENSIFSVKVLTQEKEIDEGATKILEDFIEEFEIEKLLKDVVVDLLFYGEYFLRLDVKSISLYPQENGVINIHDDVDITKIIPVFKDSDIGYYLKFEDNKILSVSPNKYVYFSLNSQRLKVKVEGVDEKNAIFKMGRSILYPVYGLIDELQFFENLLPMKFVNDALKTKLVSVSVPATTKPTDAQNIAKAFEKMINNTLNVGHHTSGSNSEEILKNLQSKVGNVKVIPNWGDKGELASQDFSADDNYDSMFEKINDIRKMILTTIGIPSNIIDEDNIKTDVIKQNIRYTKKLKSIQSSLIEGLQRLFIIHLNNKGLTYFIKENIKISFLNVLNIDDLEKLEYIDLMVSMLDNFNSYIANFEDNENVEIDWDNYVNLINENFANIVGFDILSVKEKSNSNSDEGNNDEV